MFQIETLRKQNKKISSDEHIECVTFLAQNFWWLV